MRNKNYLRLIFSLFFFYPRFFALERFLAETHFRCVGRRPWCWICVLKSQKSREVEGGGRVETNETEMQEDEANQSERRIRKKEWLVTLSLVRPVTYIASIIVTSFKQKNLKEEAGLEDDGQQDSLLRFGTQGVVFIGMGVRKSKLRGTLSWDRRRISHFDYHTLLKQPLFFFLSRLFLFYSTMLF